jgi:two-component system, NtrC family, response regulator HydG
MHKILIIDDDMDMCLLLKRFFIRNQFEVSIAHSGKKGLEELEANTPDVILCDFRLGDTDGKELLIKIKQAHPEVQVIIITGYSEIKMAVEVMKYGAFDYVTKPLFPEEILIAVKSAIALSNSIPNTASSTFPHSQAKKIIAGARKENKHSKYIFGDSKEFKDILRQMDLVAPTNYSVIISGESGSGKEAIAQEIHARSKRSNAPFIAIDCGALSKELSASELFGHEKGAFTGALNQKTGSLELANGGTVFLDEIANLSYDAQVSLLRVVQERKLRRVGGTKDIDLDIRIIVASNEQLWDATKIGRFREDLYYRFNEFSINVPPLRQRKNDILTFAHFFLNKSNVELEKEVKGFSVEVEHIFNNYKWPGNLRELKNVIKRAALLADGDIIDVKTLPFELVNHQRLAFDSINEEEVKKNSENANGVSVLSDKFLNVSDDSLGASQTEEFNKLNKYTLKTVGIDVEFEMILEALKKANFNKSKAARLLNVDRKTLYNKMKQYKEFNEQ